MTHLTSARDLAPNEYYERYILFTPNDFELIDFVFKDYSLDRVVHESELDDGTLEHLHNLGTHPRMLEYIQNRGFEFVERVTHTDQEMTKTRAQMLWHKKKRG